MNIVSAILRFTFPSLPDSFIPTWTPLLKRVMGVAIIAFGLLTAACMAYRYCFQSAGKKVIYYPVHSFSSYTKGLYQVSKVSESEDSFILHCIVSSKLQDKILKRKDRFPNSSILSLNGVRVHLVDVIRSKSKDERDQIVVQIAKDLFLNSDLKNSQAGSLVSMGMVSINPKKWLLKAIPIGTVTLRSAGVAEGHQHTEAFTFECSQDQYHQIKDLQYIGLNGSGLFVRQPEERDNRYYFTIHAGEGTREKSIFNVTRIPLNTECTLALPFVPASG